MSIKHTPGPWIVDDRHIHPRSGLTYPNGQEPETDVILMVDTDQHESGLLNETDKANLRLAAAAPELLEACRKLSGMLSQYSELEVLKDEWTEGDQIALDNARAAIAKAKTI